MQNLSPAQLLASLTDSERKKKLEELGVEGQANLKWYWPFWARPDQLAPEGNEWSTWLILSGRGWGKTRTGAEWVREKAQQNPGCLIALVAETASDARKVMVEGDSGILNISSPDFMPEYSPANRQLTWPNGSRAFTYNATQPDQLRGPQHHFAWCDEIAKWQYMQASYDQLQFGLRLGENPQQVITTTPRPLPLIKALVADPDTKITRGSTKDNMANLARPFIKQIEERYGGTRLGRQELEGEILNDIPGALWKRASIDDYRVREVPKDLSRIVVAIDPAASSGEDADESGVIAAGIAKDSDGYERGYVLADRSINGTPEEWARAAVSLYRELEADKIIAEKNNGGEMITSVIKAVDPNVPVELVHASRGKHVRAEPISALYEQGRVHHVGMFPELEDQMCEFSTDHDRDAHGSPDRMDALVWAFSFLFDRMTARRRVKTNSDANKQFKIKRNQLEGIHTGWMA